MGGMKLNDTLMMAPGLPDNPQIINHVMHRLDVAFLVGINRTDRHPSQLGASVNTDDDHLYFELKAVFMAG